MENNVDVDTTPILYMIIPSTANTVTKFCIVMIALVGFFVVLVYSSLADVKYIPNMHMFYDMLFDNFETSTTEMVSFIESIVENTQTSKEKFGNMSESVNLAYRKQSPSPSPSPYQYQSPSPSPYQSPYQYPILDIMSETFTKTINSLKLQFSKLITKSYVSGNVVRTTRNLR